MHTHISAAAALATAHRPVWPKSTGPAPSQQVPEHRAQPSVLGAPSETRQHGSCITPPEHFHFIAFRKWKLTVSELTNQITVAHLS